MKLKVLLLLGIAIDLSALSEKEKAYIEKYSVDSEIQATLDEHHEQITKKIKNFKKSGNGKHGVWTFPWLPGYYVKYNLERIYGMALMNHAIKMRNLDLLTVPDKRIYHIKGSPDHVCNDNYLVVVKAVNGIKTPKPLNLKQVRQMSTLIKKTGYLSLTVTNYIQLENDRLALIDTEGTYNSQMIPKGLFRFVQGGCNYADYEDDALAYIIKRLNVIIATHEHFSVTENSIISATGAKNVIRNYIAERKKRRSASS